MPKGLKAEGAFSHFTDEKEINRAAFTIAAKSERYRADMRFEVGEHPRPGMKMVLLRDPGVAFHATTMPGMGPNGPIPLMSGFVEDEHIAAKPPLMTFLN